MSTLRELAFDWLLNASLQIGLFTILAAPLSRFIARAKARHQHLLYLVIFVLCLAAPVVNTLWRTRSSVDTDKIQHEPAQQARQQNHFSLTWNDHSTSYDLMLLLPAAKASILAIWQVLFLYQLIHFGRAIDRVRRLRQNASRLTPGDLATAGAATTDLGLNLPGRVLLLKSTSIDDPVTIGVFHPAIILPSKLIPSLDRQDLTAILAHEYGHICRNDFLVLLVCQLIALPVAWHPGIRYLMAKISETRELACDEYAAACIGKPLVYARSLLRLASLCLRVPRNNAMELSIFNADNLEDRIMKLTQKKTSLSRANLIGLALSITLVFGSTAVLARAVSLQEAPASDNTLKQFAGTWQWMFHGQSFATMTLIQNGSEITGSATESRIALDDNGELSKADPTDNKTPAQITRTKLEGEALHVTVGDSNHPFEFLVTLRDATHAEIHPVGAPSNMKPIQAERAN